MCSCGITFGVSAMAAITSSVKSRGCGEVKRTRSQPVDGSARPQQLGEGLPIAELRAVRVHVLTQQGDLLHPLGDQHLDLGQDLAGSPIGLPAAQRRHDAEGAGVVAAHADRDPGGVGGVPPGRQRRGEPLERLGDLDLGGLFDPGPFQQQRKLADVVGAEDHVHPGRPADDLAAVLLGQAAADGDLQARVLLLGRQQLSEIAVQPVVGVLPHGAGVEHDHVRAVPGGPRVAGFLQQPGQPLGVVHVHLAPVGPDLVRAHWHLMYSARARYAPIRLSSSLLARTTRGPRPQHFGVVLPRSVQTELGASLTDARRIAWACSCRPAEHCAT